jgi:hypothetical protein
LEPAFIAKRRGPGGCEAHSHSYDEAITLKYCYREAQRTSKNQRNFSGKLWKFISCLMNKACNALSPKNNIYTF